MDHMFLTSALVGGERSATRPCHFRPQYPLAGLAPDSVWTMWRSENSDASVAIRYTD
jgi:hypothetical protein